MKDSKILGIVIILLAVVISAAFPIIFAVNGVLDFYTGTDLAIYITDKVIVSGFLIFIGATIVMGRWMYFSSLPVISWTIALQFLPLFNRLFGLLSGIEEIKKWIWSINILVSLVVILLYVILVLAAKINSKRYKEVYQNVKSEEIKVVKTSSYLDDNGDLRGPGN